MELKPCIIALWATLLPLSAPSLFGEDVIVQYLVYEPRVTAIEKFTVRSMGREDRNQPAQNTRTLNSPNTTNYYLLIVTPVSADESDVLDGLETAGKVMKISETRITGFPDGRGGQTIRPVTRDFNPLPSDFYTDWADVKVSS